MRIPTVVMAALLTHAMLYAEPVTEAPPGRMTMLPWDMNDSMSLGTNLWQSPGAAGGGNFGNNGGNSFTNCAATISFPQW